MSSCFDTTARRAKSDGLRFVTLIFASLVLLAACGTRTDADKAAEDPGDVDPVDTIPTVLNQVSSLIEASPPEVQSLVMADPQGFLSLASAVVGARRLNWVLVDKNNAVPADFVPSGLVDLRDYADPLLLNRADLRLEKEAATALADMAREAADDGVSIVASSAYRSYAYQDGLFQRHVDQLGIEEASRVSARPGHSQHQLGTAVDFGSITMEFRDTTAGNWLAKNAWRFGFSLSYPEGAEEITGYGYEPWHFRYIGLEATRLERIYFAGLQQSMLEFLHRNHDALRLISP